jgi:predicted permease
MATLLRRLRARLRHLLHLHLHRDDDLAREIESHRAMAQAALESCGLSPAEAKPRSMTQMGNVTLARERARDVWRPPRLESIWQDIGYAGRTLRRSPGFTAMAAAALVVAIGLNTSLFSVFNAVALKPWPIPQPDRAIVVFSEYAGGRATGVSPVEYRLLRDQARSARLVATRTTLVQFGGDPEDANSPARLVSANYFDVLGIGVKLGRGFLPDEDQPGNPRPVVVLGDAAWRQRFAADADVIGRPVTLSGVRFTVIGVAAPDATDSPLESRRPLAWMPLAVSPLLNPNQRFFRDFLTSPGHCCVQVAGRLLAGASRATAAAELTTLDHQFRVGQHQTDPSRVLVADTTLATQPDAARVMPIFALLFGGVLLLLLLACANVGNLQLARAISRRREIGIRVSLGASRLRVVRQLLTEGLVLAVGAGALSIYVAHVLPPFLLAQLPGGEDAVSLRLGPDLRVLVFTTTISLLACGLFSLAPALRGTRVTAEAVRGGRPEATTGRVPLRTALLAIQVAISTVLLVAAGLLVRGVLHAATFDVGFRTKDVVAASLQLPRGTYSPQATHALLLNLEQALASADTGPVGTTGIVPLAHVTSSENGIRLAGEPKSAGRTVDLQTVSPAYFDVLRIPVVAGRAFTAADGGDALVINETLARTLWPSGVAVGRTLVAGDNSGQVVGVVKDAYLTSLDRVPPTVFQQDRAETPQLVLRDTPAARERVRAIMASLDSRTSVTFHLLSDNLREYLRESIVGASIAASLGLAGLGLAAIGVFGVFSYIVSERSREIGIRLAIGARARDVVGLVLGRTSGALAVGLAVGVGLSLVASPILRSAIYGVSPRDPLAMLAAAVTLTAAALAASAVPIRRALRVDPAVTLRQD